MKVLMVNGSPHEKGSTHAALCEVGKALAENGVDWEILQVGHLALRGCQGCGACSKLDGQCVWDDDIVNAGLAKSAEADGFIFGSPVHYAGITGALKCYLDRSFFAGRRFAGKPGAGVAVCRRGGSTAALEQLEKYFTIAQMPVVSSHYWNMVHGGNAEEVKRDEEGMQVMRRLGHNMAWMLRCLEEGKKQNIVPHYDEPRVWTNFIR